MCGIRPICTLCQSQPVAGFSACAHRTAHIILRTSHCAHHSAHTALRTSFCAHRTAHIILCTLAVWWGDEQRFTLHTGNMYRGVNRDWYSCEAGCHVDEDGYGSDSCHQATPRETGREAQTTREWTPPHSRQGAGTVYPTLHGCRSLIWTSRKYIIFVDYICFLLFPL